MADPDPLENPDVLCVAEISRPQRLLRGLIFDSYSAAVVVLAGKVERRRETAGGAGWEAMSVLENVGGGMRKRRKSDGGMREDAQLLHGINRGFGKVVWKGHAVSGKGGQDQTGSDCGSDPGCTAGVLSRLCVLEEGGRARGRKSRQQNSDAIAHKAVVQSALVELLWLMVTPPLTV